MKRTEVYQSISNSHPLSSYTLSKTEKGHVEELSATLNEALACTRCCIPITRAMLHADLESGIYSPHRDPAFRLPIDDTGPIPPFAMALKTQKPGYFTFARQTQINAFEATVAEETEQQGSSHELGLYAVHRHIYEHRLVRRSMVHLCRGAVDLESLRQWCWHVAPLKEEEWDAWEGGEGSDDDEFEYMYGCRSATDYDDPSDDERENNDDALVKAESTERRHEHGDISGIMSWPECFPITSREVLAWYAGWKEREMALERSRIRWRKIMQERDLQRRQWAMRRFGSGRYNDEYDDEEERRVKAELRELSAQGILNWRSADWGWEMGFVGVGVVFWLVR
ncbi:hypothetical protein AJ80_03852 [Polytolypa hystricis UAMH7299]|uniref:Uncharacterized protein n=1 Tax=Polytolypa hystricis (strain UAMH7299) TaxID=1447883 RepID=A0A2B7YGG6_POLH7|nr:hypothetical protein AJ80_03852 [Polytolypa hystricis UAMH7299]